MRWVYVFDEVKCNSSHSMVAHHTLATPQTLEGPLNSVEEPAPLKCGGVEANAVGHIIIILQRIPTTASADVKAVANFTALLAEMMNS